MTVIPEEIIRKKSVQYLSHMQRVEINEMHSTYGICNKNAGQTARQVFHGFRMRMRLCIGSDRLLEARRYRYISKGPKNVSPTSIPSQKTASNQVRPNLYRDTAQPCFYHRRSRMVNKWRFGWGGGRDGHFKKIILHNYYFARIWSFTQPTDNFPSLSKMSSLTPPRDISPCQ